MDTFLLQQAYNDSRKYFDEGHTLDVNKRNALLKKLYVEIERRADDICQAVFLDFKKPMAEGYLVEVGPVLAELKHFISNIDRWSAPKSVSTPLLIMPSRSKIHKEPKGVVFIMSPWNYPFNLAMIPMITAVAAGNTVLLKPAHETPATSMIVKEIVNAVFPLGHVNVLIGNGPDIGNYLMDNHRFDHIFFTGSQRVGSLVMSKAAKFLTPVTLELGGKSPAIIDKNTDIDFAAKKIVWGKFLNAGQTCVCPDHLFVHEEVKDVFVSKLIEKIEWMFTKDQEKTKEFGRLINNTRFEKVSSYLQDGKVLYGGKLNKEDRYIQPTLLEPTSEDSPCMKEEIFGPILPILTFKNKEELVSRVRKNRYPLSCYIFSDDGQFREFILKKIEFGGGCVNNVIQQFGNPNLPFGGIQHSGMGGYHGERGFLEFSHQKSVLYSSKLMDIALKYQPYTSEKMKWIKMAFKI